jgi:hypothetical protein
MEEDGFFERLIFSDECTFHLYWKVNRHDVRIWGTKNPKSVVEVACDCPKVNAFCAVSTFKVYALFFFSEQTVTGIAFLDTITDRLLPQLNEDSAAFILQMEGAPPHFHRHVRELLNQHLPQRWIGHGNDDDQMLLAWPPRVSPVSQIRAPAIFYKCFGEFTKYEHSRVLTSGFGSIALAKKSHNFGALKELVNAYN